LAGRHSVASETPQRIVLHVGLPKTGTTTLQNNFFPHLEVSPGVFADLSKFQPEAYHRFIDIFHGFARGSHGNLVNRAAERLKNWGASLRFSNCPIQIISLEGLSQWRSPTWDSAAWPTQHAINSKARLGQHPLVSFLDIVSKSLPDGVELSTVLTLRNQSDWLGSLAAETGEKDNSYVGRLLESDDAFLDYYSLVTGIENTINVGSHLTLLFEDGLNNNAREISNFLGLEAPNWLFDNLASQRENLKNVEPGVWVSTIERADTVKSIIASRFGSRAPTRIPVLRVFSRFVFSALRLVLGSRKISIHLAKTERDKIRLHCSQSNLLLANRLKRDLKSLGY
jgi:hypothetical protein